MTQLVREERPAVDMLVTVDPVPPVGREPLIICLASHREGRRAKSKNHQEERFVIPAPGVGNETAFRTPPVRDCAVAEHPLPLRAEIERVPLLPEALLV